MGWRVRVVGKKMEPKIKKQEKNEKLKKKNGGGGGT